MEALLLRVFHVEEMDNTAHSGTINAKEHETKNNKKGTARQRTLTKN